MRRFVILGVAVVALAVVGCGSDSDSDDGAGGSGAGGTGGTGGNNDVCTTLQNLAPAIDEVNVAEAPPTPQGLMGISALTDGLYYFTADTVYTGTSGSSGPGTAHHQDTWRISGNTVEIVHLDQDSGQTMFGKGTITISGNAISVVLECPAAMAGAVIGGPFSADATHVYMFDEDLDNVDTYTLQP
jgi:hypothetical protein